VEKNCAANTQAVAVQFVTSMKPHYVLELYFNPESIILNLCK